ncbi:MAG: hypothetical protein ACREMX_01585 [Gemmatimonadales bacterium]
MTDAELALLRSLSQAEVVTFMPEGSTAAAVARFDALVKSLREMQKAGWVELEVSSDERRRVGRQPKYRAAAARCTERGREALREAFGRWPRGEPVL